MSGPQTWPLDGCDERGCVINWSEAFRKIDGRKELDKSLKHYDEIGKQFLNQNQIMHYRNGREAKNGDKIVKLGGANGAEVVSFGVLHSATPGNDYCNGSIAPLTNDTGACMCDCLHVDDVSAVLAEKGLDKRPIGK